MKPAVKYLKEETEMENKNKIENRNTKDNAFKFHLYFYLKYIYHLIFNFIFTLESKICFISKCNISNIINIFYYLYFLEDNTNKKRNDNYCYNLKNDDSDSNINIKFIVSKLLFNGTKYIKGLTYFLRIIINKRRSVLALTCCSIITGGSAETQTVCFDLLKCIKI